MTRNHQTTYRMTPETRAGIDLLARIWGPVTPLSGADVVAEAIRRALEAEHKAAKRRNGKVEK